MNPDPKRPDPSEEPEPHHPREDRRRNERSVDDPEIADLGATLRAALAPMDDVRDKARHKVDRALNARSTVSGLTSIGSCAIDTVRHLLTNPTPGADRYSMADELFTAGNHTASGEPADEPTANTPEREVPHD